MSIQFCILIKCIAFQSKKLPNQSSIVREATLSKNWSSNTLRRYVISHNSCQEIIFHEKFFPMLFYLQNTRNR